MKINDDGDYDYPIYGRGKQAVYVYYFKTYREYAKEHNLDYWPCKIGFSATSVFRRLESQNAAFPEGITIPFIIKTKSGEGLEGEIHRLLEAIKPIRKWPIYQIHKDNRCYSYDGGADWYLTNPEEIYNVVFDENTREILFREIKREQDILDAQIAEQMKKYKAERKKIMSRRPLYTDSELDALQKNSPKLYEKIMKMYEKENPKKS